MDDLTVGGSSTVEAKEYKTTAVEMFVDATFELQGLRKWKALKGILTKIARI